MSYYRNIRAQKKAKNAALAKFKSDLYTIFELFEGNYDVYAFRPGIVFNSVGIQTDGVWTSLQFELDTIAKLAGTRLINQELSLCDFRIVKTFLYECESKKSKILLKWFIKVIPYIMIMIEVEKRLWKKERISELKEEIALLREDARN